MTESLLAKIQNHHCGRNIRNLTITHKGNFIILSGKTSSFYLKQVVQELISKDVFAVNLGSLLNPLPVKQIAYLRAAKATQQPTQRMFDDDHFFRSAEPAARYACQFRT